MPWAAVALLLTSASVGDLEPLPAPSDHFPAQSWAPTGWLAFRWGMGFGDVLDVLKNSDEPFRVARGFACDDTAGFRGMTRNKEVLDLADCWMEPESHSFEFVGERPLVAFGFWKKRLYTVTMFVTSHSFDVHAQRLATVLASIRGEYGREADVAPKGFVLAAKPTAHPATAIFTWSVPRLEVRFTTLTYQPHDSRRVTFHLEYSDPLAASDLKSNGRARTSEREKL